VCGEGVREGEKIREITNKDERRNFVVWEREKKGGTKLK
jgi:hypothetical protein